MELIKPGMKGAWNQDVRLVDLVRFTLAFFDSHCWLYISFPLCNLPQRQSPNL